MPTGSELGRIARFAIVGAVGLGVNSLVLWLLTDHAAIYYLLSSVIATEAAILCNFGLNHAWTFRAHSDGRPLFGRLLRFNLISVGGLTVTIVMLFALKQMAGLHYLIANTIAVFSASAWNYAANRRWTWQITPSAQQ
jgi:dolichol-phosphate mannosyltransferase